jgi:hypothetical protein
MENSVLKTPPHRLSVHIFGMIKSSAEGWQGILALVVIVALVAAMMLWR